MIALAGRVGVPGNVRLHVGSGRDLDGLPGGAFDLAFSHLVFQHISDRSAVVSYLGEIARVLAPEGIAVLQFDTRPASPVASAVHALPDPLLLLRLRRRAGDLLRLVFHGFTDSSRGSSKTASSFFAHPYNKRRI